MAQAALGWTASSQSKKARERCKSEMNVQIERVGKVKTGFLSLFEEGGTVVTPMHVSHVRTTTPTHLHTTH